MFKTASQSLHKKWSQVLADSALLREAISPYKKLIWFGVSSLVVVDILEMIQPLLLKDAVDLIVEHAQKKQLLRIAGFYFLLSCGQSICRYIWRMYLVRTGFLAGEDLRNRFAGHLYRLSISFFDRKRIGDLMSLATNDIDAVRMAISAGILTIADALFYCCTVPVAMFILAPKLTLIVLAPLLVIPFIVTRNEREIHRRFEKVQKCTGEISALAQEGLGGIRVTKAFAIEQTQISRFERIGQEFIRLSLHLARVESSFGPVLDFTMSLGLVLLIFFGAESFFSGAITLGTFVAFQRYILKMAWPMVAVGLGVTFYQRAVASSGRLREILDEKPDLTEKTTEIITEKTTAPLPTPIAGRTAGKIEFLHLHFRYPGSSKPVLNDVNFCVEPGSRVAFVGPIGCGKSSLLSLIPRIYPVKDGMIFIDGMDLNDWSLVELRRQVGFVSQDVFLFSESVSRNIAYGLQSCEQSELRPEHQSLIESACADAVIHDEIRALPQGYETRLGERGITLSGGQKQRVTIARALARSPSILILDDALSSVDVHTEEEILSRLRQRKNRNTELIVAHRISTIQDADEIIVLDQGRIIQQGRHQKLIREKDSLYHRLYEHQKLEEEINEWS